MDSENLDVETASTRISTPRPQGAVDTDTENAQPVASRLGRFLYRLAFHRFQATDKWQAHAYTTWVLLGGMTIIMIAYAILDDTNIFAQTLETSFMSDHGALDLPQQAKQFPYRAFSLIFLHFDFWHYFSNMLLFVWLGLYLECKYHWYRWIPILLLGAIGSTVVFMAVYVWRTWNSLGRFPYDLQHVDVADNLVFAGFSGVVYTGVGMYIMETVVNWNTIQRRWIKVFITCLLTLEPIVQIVFRDEFYDGVAVSAHIGGLLVGLGPAIVYIPNQFGRVLDMVITQISILSYIVLFGMLPVFVLLAVYGSASA